MRGNPLRNIYDRLILCGRLMRDPRVPVWAKVIPVFVFLYVVSPIDLIPDMIIGLGQLDDITILISGLRLFESLSPPEVVEEHRRMVQSRHTPPEVVDSPGYRVIGRRKKRG